MKLRKPTLLILSGLAAAFTVSSCGPSEKKEESKSATSGGSAAAPANVPAGDLVDLMPMATTEKGKPSEGYPKALFVGTPVPTGNIANLETPDPEAVKARLMLKVPKGTANVALGKKVTSSDPAPIIGELNLVTDGDADGADGCYVELAPGPQWVQIDLGAEYNIWKILLWHFHKNTAIYFNVVAQVSDDPTFKDESKITTLYNNDLDGKSGHGKGTDKNYVETNHGRLIDGKGTKARYVRFYSNGNSGNEMNHYVEVQVYGTPAK